MRIAAAQARQPGHRKSQPIELLVRTRGLAELVESEPSGVESDRAQRTVELYVFDEGARAEHGPRVSKRGKGCWGISGASRMVSARADPPLERDLPRDEPPVGYAALLL